MSNSSTGCLSIFKKSHIREANIDGRHIKRSRSFIGQPQSKESNLDDKPIRRSFSSIGEDPLAYLKPNREVPDRQAERMNDAKEKYKQNYALQRAREERQYRQMIHSKEEKPREKTLAELKRERANALKLIYEGKQPDSALTGTKNEREIGPETGSGRGSETEIGTETEIEPRPGTGTRIGTGIGRRIGRMLGAAVGNATGSGTGKGAGKATETDKSKTETTTKEMPLSEDDYEKNIETLEQQIENLDLRSKVMATMWVSRLRTPTQNAEEIKARNLITYHLIKCRNDNIFQKVPFNLPPTSETLANIKQKMLLTRDTPCRDQTLANRMETKAYLNKLFHDSYDCGNFLGRLPVPRDGAFFILHMRPNL